MNEANYRMGWDERRQYAYDYAYTLLENDTDAFVNACDELDSWDGFLGDDRCETMDMIDEFFSKPSELLDRMDAFDPNHEYFYFNGYGYLESCDDKYEHYSDIYTVKEVLDKLIDEYNHVDIYENDSLKSVLEVLYNEDFGIEDGWEYDEDMDEDNAPEETDDEFMERIDSI